jgi:hypothetical protein
MSEPTYTVILTRSEVLAFLKDAEEARFPSFTHDGATIRVISGMSDWWKQHKYIAQLGRKGHEWKTIGTSATKAKAAELLNDEMQRHGFRFSELHAHREDLAEGHVLTADDGYAFRVVIEETTP